MDTATAFVMGVANRDKPFMVFDWDKAARRIKETGAKNAGAGLASDWEYTGGTILSDGAPVHDSYTYLGSTWARPELDLDGEVEECWTLQSDSPGWNEKTKWPESALAILA